MNGLLLETQRATLIALKSLRRSTLPPHLLLGERGEFEALFHLRRHGYLVIERRWRSPDHNGDLDLIAWDPTTPPGQTLCFVEVKTRATRDLTPAASAVNDAKRNMIRRMGRSFLRTLPREDRDELLIRCDVVSVYLSAARPECEILRDAFPWREAVSSRYGV